MENFRQEKLRDFTIIRNAIFRDNTISAKAKGVACEMLSLPPSWNFSIRGLVTRFADGEASIRSALIELEEAGYLRREQSRDGGKFGSSVYIITDTLKSEKPYAENPHAVNSVAENQSQLNTKELNTNKSNTKRFIPPTVDEVREYIRERGSSVNAEAFVDYYASQKWKKANGRPVEDWKACVRTWERNGYDNRRSSQKREGVRASTGKVQGSVGNGEQPSWFKPIPTAPVFPEDE